MLISLTDCFMYLLSNANPRLSPPEILKLFIPMIFPLVFIKGPPEFPGFKAASVCM